MIFEHLIFSKSSFTSSPCLYLSTSSYHTCSSCASFFLYFPPWHALCGPSFLLWSCRRGCRFPSLEFGLLRSHFLSSLHYCRRMLLLELLHCLQLHRPLRCPTSWLPCWLAVLCPPLRLLPLPLLHFQTWASWHLASACFNPGQSDPRRMSRHPFSSGGRFRYVWVLAESVECRLAGILCLSVAHPQSSLFALTSEDHSESLPRRFLWDWYRW